MPAGSAAPDVDLLPLDLLHCILDHLGPAEAASPSPSRVQNHVRLALPPRFVCVGADVARQNNIDDDELFLPSVHTPLTQRAGAAGACM